FEAENERISTGMRRRISLSVFVLTAILAQGCSGEVGGSGDSTTVPPPPAGVAVSVAPKRASVLVGDSTSFTAAVTGTSAGQSTGVTGWVQEWGGGSVNGWGQYPAPAPAGTYHVVATSVADTTRSATATVVVSVPSSIDTAGLIPPDRVTVRAPGVPGGIPSYSSIFATIAAATCGKRASDPP